MCDCITQVNEQLKPSNTELDLAVIFMDLKSRFKIATKKIDTKVRRGPATLIPTYCPICGEYQGLTGKQGD
jgi:hypothetical protein